MEFDLGGFLTTLFSGTGLLAVVVLAIMKRPEQKQKIERSSIKTAMELRDAAVESYKVIEVSLGEARRQLNIAEVAMEHAKLYIDYLQGLLAVHGVPYLAMEDFKEHKGIKKMKNEGGHRG